MKDFEVFFKHTCEQLDELRDNLVHCDFATDEQLTAFDNAVDAFKNLKTLSISYGHGLGNAT